MTEPTTTPEDAVGAEPAAAPTASAAPGADPAPTAAPPSTRRWSTLTLAIAGGAALVLGLGIGGVSGWAIGHARHPGSAGADVRDDHRFSDRGELPGRGDGQGPGDGRRGDGGMPQQGDDTDPGDGSGS